MRLNLFFSALLLCFLSTTALANETLLKKTLQKQFPDSSIESVKKTPYTGLYEVIIDQDVVYTDSKGTYLLAGNLFDTASKQNLTAKRAQEIRDARKIDISSLPLEGAMKIVKGNGSRKLVIFSDPNCSFCKRLEKELVGVSDVTIYTLLYPVLSGSEEVAKAIWCSTDKLKAWNDLMLDGIPPASAPAGCTTPLEANLAAGHKHRVTGTPTLIFANGKVAPGMLPSAEIEKRLNVAATAK